MHFGEFVLGIVFILAVVNVIKHIVQPGGGQPGANEARLQEALRQVREEMTQLRRESQEVILTFDSSLQRLDTRMQHLERQSLGAAEQRDALPSIEVGSRVR